MKDLHRELLKALTVVLTGALGKGVGEVPENQTSRRTVELATASGTLVSWLEGIILGPSTRPASRVYRVRAVGRPLACEKKALAVRLKGFCVVVWLSRLREPLISPAPLPQPLSLQQPADN
jgi:hypothetical protein